MVSESKVESRINKQLENLKWLDEQITQQNPKTKEQKESLNGKRPDFILYKKNSTEPLVIIEAKKPNENLEKAIQQGIDYAKRLNAPIVFATDGKFINTYIYKSLENGYIKRGLDEKNIKEDGKRKARFYQWLSENGKNMLSIQIGKILASMEECQSIDAFKEKMKQKNNILSINPSLFDNLDNVTN